MVRKDGYIIMLLWIKQNTLTGTYYILESGKRVKLSKNLTRKEKDYIQEHKHTQDKEFIVWR